MERTHGKKTCAFNLDTSLPSVHPRQIQLPLGLGFPPLKNVSNQTSGASQTGSFCESSKTICVKMIWKLWGTSHIRLKLKAYILESLGNWGLYSISSPNFIFAKKKTESGSQGCFWNVTFRFLDPQSRAISPSSSCKWFLSHNHAWKPRTQVSRKILPCLD